MNGVVFDPFAFLRKPVHKNRPSDGCPTPFRGYFFAVCCRLVPLRGPSAPRIFVKTDKNPFGASCCRSQFIDILPKHPVKSKIHTRLVSNNVQFARVKAPAALQKKGDIMSLNANSHAPSAAHCWPLCWRELCSWPTCPQQPLPRTDSDWKFAAFGTSSSAAVEQLWAKGGIPFPSTSS